MGRILKPEVGMREQTSHLDTLSIWPTWSSCIRRKIRPQQDCPKKGSLNAKEGMTKKGGRTPQKQVGAQPTSPDEAPSA